MGACATPTAQLMDRTIPLHGKSMIYSVLLVIFGHEGTTMFVFNYKNQALNIKLTDAVPLSIYLSY